MGNTHSGATKLSSPALRVTVTFGSLSLYRKGGPGWGREVRDKTMNAKKTETNAAATAGRRTRKHYTEAFKTEAVAHCERHGGDIHRTAVELGINPWTLRDWVQEHRRRRRPPSPPLDAAGLAPEHAVRGLRRLLGVTRSGHYAWRARQTGPRRREDAQLGQEVLDAFQASRRTNGRVRLTRELKNRGRACGERRVARHMKEHRLQARPPRRFRVATTDSRHDGPVAPNRLARAAPPLRPDTVWATGFTFIPPAKAGSTSP